MDTSTIHNSKYYYTLHKSKWQEILLRLILLYLIFSKIVNKVSLID